MSDLLGFLNRARSWWRKKQRERAEALNVERKYVVQVDDDGISVIHPNGDVQTVDWKSVQSIAIHTTDGGPWAIDCWWVIAAGETYCMWPRGATGEEKARDCLFERFPDIDNEALVLAYGCTDNAHFVCWER